MTTIISFLEQTNRFNRYVLYIKNLPYDQWPIHITDAIAYFNATECYVWSFNYNKLLKMLESFPTQPTYNPAYENLDDDWIMLKTACSMPEIDAFTAFQKIYVG